MSTLQPQAGRPGRERHTALFGARLAGWLRPLLSGGLLAGMLVVSSGCVGTIYAIDASAAASTLEEAKTLGAAELAEYEYFYAKEHLEKAQEEAASANYGDAIHYANIAEEYAEKAVELSRGAHRGAGR